MTLFEQEQQLELHGDVLETIFSRVPLVDLVSASQVSQPWRDAVSSSLRHRNKPRPWLILHAQANRHPRLRSALRPLGQNISAIDSVHLRPQILPLQLPLHALSFSLDPLNLTWHHVDPPRVWRRDPIVARVGSSVVIAGGGCDFEDDPLAVEIYDLNARVWRSIAATAEKLIVVEKESGVTYIFDPETKS